PAFPVILGRLGAECDARQCIEVMPTGTGLLRGSDQLDYFLHAGAIEVLTGIEAGGNLQFRQGLPVAGQRYQASRHRIVILGPLVEPKGLAKFLLRISELLRVDEGCAQIMMRESRVRIESYRAAQHRESFCILSGEQ